VSSFIAVDVDLVSGAEIGRRLGVSREAVRQWRRKPGFPEPLTVVGRSVVWDWGTVEVWAAGRGSGRANPAKQAQGEACD